MPVTSRPEPAAPDRPRRRWWRVAVPAVLVVVVLAAAGTAVALDRAERVDPPTGGLTTRLATPVVSVRRMPSVLAAPIADRRLRADLAKLVATLPPDSCVTVRDASGAVLFDHHGALPLRPASNEKLLTAAAALEVLGAQTRFRTTAVTAAPITGGVLQGDLVVVGGGDPVLGTAGYSARYRNQPQLFSDLDHLAASIAGAGVRRVTGSVRGDESRYDRVRSVAGWPARYLTDHDVGPLSALAVNDGFTAYPAHTGANNDADPAPDPAVQAAVVLTELLVAHGIVVDGAPGSGPAPAGARTVAALDSPPVGEIVAAMLRESDNQTAEMLMKELGRTAGDPSTAGGAGVVARTLHRAAPTDGSGLSVDDRATCHELLAVFDRPTTGAAIDDALAVAGKTGTLRFRFLGSPLVGKVRAKSGSLTSVRSLTGAVEDDDGVLQFSAVVSVPYGQRVPSEVDATVQRVVQTLLDHPRVADEAKLRPEAVEAG